MQHASLLQCIDKAGRHGIGETANIVCNLILKKREHVMSLSNTSVPLSTKTDVIFSPVSNCKLLPADDIKAATAQFRQQTETSALVAVAAASRIPKVKASTSSKPYLSPLQLNKYRGGRAKSLVKSSKKFFLRNREYFSRRDKYVRGRGQGRRAQQPSTTSQQ